MSSNATCYSFQYNHYAFVYWITFLEIPNTNATTKGSLYSAVKLDSVFYHKQSCNTFDMYIVLTMSDKDAIKIADKVILTDTPMVLHYLM